jgi:hypothetical protein
MGLKRYLKVRQQIKQEDINSLFDEDQDGYYNSIVI